MTLTRLVNGSISASITSDGQLVSIQKKDHEYMHGGGKPEDLKDPQDKIGWDKSEIIMFPIIGRPGENIVSMNGKKYSMGQHGISRAIPSHIEDVINTSGENNNKNNDFALICQSHNGESINNPRYDKDPSAAQKLEWPPYLIDKSIQVLPSAVRVGITVQNLSDSNMKYRLGWHPAFRMQGTNDDAVFKTMNSKSTGHNTIYMNEIIEESLTGAYLIDNVDSISYIDRKSERGVQLAFEGFNSAMMWTKSAKSGMFCIEPVTQLPDKKRNYLDDVTHETLASSERKQYLVHIIPI